MNTAAVCKSLADDTRLSIVRHLASQVSSEVPCQDIVGDCSLALGLTQPTMSHHFKLLVQSGVLSERKVGKQKLYLLERDRLYDLGIDVTKL